MTGVRERVVLAYSGSLASSAAIAWLIERHGAEVVTLTLDVGQSGELDEIRARALSCGAVRAHVIDARDPFARTCVIPSLRDGTSTDPDITTLAYPLIARTLVEVAAIEGAGAVAHASTGTGLDEAVARVDAAIRVLAAAREWMTESGNLAEYARRHKLPVAADAARKECNLLARRSVEPSVAPETNAHVDITFDNGVPAAVNGVPMALTELIESLSLIAGQHGIGYGEIVHAPAAIVLRAAYGASRETPSTVRVKLHKGGYTVVPSADPELVSHS